MADPAPTFANYSMRGPRFVRHTIKEWLQANLPAHLDDMRAEWDLHPDELPDPRRYEAREPEAIDDLVPCIAITSGSQRSRKMEHGVDGGLYRVTYPIEVFVWVKTEKWDPAQDMRDDMSTALKALLLSNPTFGTDTMLLNESTLVESFSDVQRVKGDRFVAGAFLGFDLDVEETLGPLHARPRSRLGSVIVEDRGFGSNGPDFVPFPHPAFEETP